MALLPKRREAPEALELLTPESQPSRPRQGIKRGHTSFSVRARGMPAGPGLSVLLAVRFGVLEDHVIPPVTPVSASLGSCDFPPLSWRDTWPGWDGERVVWWGMTRLRAACWEGQSWRALGA